MKITRRWAGGLALLAGETVRSTEAPAAAWHQVERMYSLPAEYDRLRFELCITSPGDVWIDDVRIEPIAAQVARD